MELPGRVISRNDYERNISLCVHVRLFLGAAQRARGRNLALVHASCVGIEGISQAKLERGVFAGRLWFVCVRLKRNHGSDSYDREEGLRSVQKHSSWRKCSGRCCRHDAARNAFAGCFRRRAVRLPFHSRSSSKLRLKSLPSRPFRLRPPYSYPPSSPPSSSNLQAGCRPHPSSGQTELQSR